jgi:nucleoside-diphosphate-sugar epimerase
LDFVETEKPHFSVIILHPVNVSGQNLLQMLFKSLFSRKPLFVPCRGVHIDDVAAAHVRALDLASTPISSYLLSAKNRTWEQVLPFAKSKFPEAGFTAKPKPGERVIVETPRAEAELGFSS